MRSVVLNKRSNRSDGDVGVKFGRFFRRRVSKMTVEPFLSRVYAFLIFPCASVASYALPPTIVRS